MDSNAAELIGGAIRLQRAAFEAIEVAPHGLRTAALVLLLAGASETLGQCVVLILNRVSRVRFFFSLALGGLELIAEALLWIASVWLLLGLFDLAKPPLASTARVIGLAYAPMLLGFLVFLPYLGPLVARLLRLWVFLAVAVGTSVVFDVPPIRAALIASAGFLTRWLLLELFALVGSAVSRLFRRPRGAGVGANLALESGEPGA